MALSSDLVTLVTRGAHYAAHWDVVRELPHVAHDLLVGASLPRKEEGRAYADFHVHLPRTASIRRVIGTISPRVGICSIVTREPKYDEEGGYLDFDTTLEKLKREGFSIKDCGRFVTVYCDSGPLYFLRAIEVYGKEGQEIVIVGSDKEFRDNRVNDMPLDDLIAKAEDIGALWFIDHPMIDPVVSPVHFVYLTKKKEKRLRKWIEKHTPILETGNNQNTLWMAPANIAAQRIAEEYRLPQVANSDSHFRVREIGLSRTSFPGSLLNDHSGDAFIGSLRKALRKHKDEVVLESNYSSIWAFSQYMVLPTVLWKLRMFEAARRVRGITD